MMNLKPIRRIAVLLFTGLLTATGTPALAADSETINDQVTRQKDVDDGGSGRYRAIVVSEKTLPDFTIYRPRNIQYAARREGPLPILIWCNGACSGSSIGYERMLNEMASHGRPRPSSAISMRPTTPSRPSIPTCKPSSTSANVRIPNG